MPTEYVASDGEKVSIPDKINPFSVLGISSSASHSETKIALMREVTKSKRQDRALASLSYHMITSPSKYRKVGSSYLIKDPDIFVLAAMGHKDRVFAKIDADASLVNSVDDCKRTVMYIAARGGFGDIVELLIQKEADVNHKQKDNSTPLHAASYFNQTEIVTMLLVYGADPTVINNHGNTPYDESSGKTKKAFDDFKKQPRETSVLYFYASEIIIKKSTKTFRGKQISIELSRDDSQLDPYTKVLWDSIQRTWRVAYHGTKLKYLKSILTHGLLPSGTKLPTGETVTPPSGHISTDTTVSGIPEWAKAVFVSPSIMCASHCAYAEYCGSGDSQWCVVIKVLVNPSSYTQHGSTATPKEEPIRGEPRNLEYRVKETPDHKMERPDMWKLMKSLSLITPEVGRSVIVKSVIFMSTKFRNNVRDYNLTHEDLKRFFK